ncbi:hypothetical protein [Paenibacillus puerhi]|uniref:hypothetical protein n=1 Tax=Paenibacillus puerhi TaxID=2692622 RepID=UPI00135AE4A4|nr:hypothetical protein [Paenibacillus puerhi]
MVQLAQGGPNVVVVDYLAAIVSEFRFDPGLSGEKPLPFRLQLVQAVHQCFGGDKVDSIEGKRQKHLSQFEGYLGTLVISTFLLLKIA